MKTLLLILVSSIALSIIMLTTISCDKDEPSGPSNLSTVTYGLDSEGCLAHANNYDDYSHFESDDYESKTYIWHCANYKGQTEVYVSLDFDNNNDGTDCLKLGTEYISSGICD